MRVLAFSSLALGVLAACKQPAPRPTARSSPAGPVSTGDSSVQGAPEDADFTVTTNARSLGDFAGTAAAAVSFTELRRGTFRFWQALHIPLSNADSVRAAILARHPTMIVVSDNDEDVNQDYLLQFIDDDGAVPCAARLPALDAVLVDRTRRLGNDAKRLERELSTATPSADYRKAVAKEQASRDQLAKDLRKPTAQAADKIYVSLLIFERPLEEVACLLSTGAEGAPEPEQLATALRAWRTKYGAELTSWRGSDGITLHVARPPSKISELRELARQVQLLCSVPGVEDLDVRASQASKLLVLVGNQELDCSW